MSQVAQSGTSFAGPAIDVRWNLGDVLPATSGKIFQSSVLDHLEGMLVEFESSRTLLSESITNGEFMRLLDDYESICRIRAKLGSYAYMYFSQDTKSQDARTFKSRAEEIEADAANRTLFFELWWKSLDSEKTSVLLDNSSSYSYYLRHLIATKPYTLSETVEQTINLKDVTGRADSPAVISPDSRFFYLRSRHWNRSEKAYRRTSPRFILQ